MTTFGISTAIFGNTRVGAREFELMASQGFTSVELAAGGGRFDPQDPAQVTAVRAEAAAARLEIGGLSVALSDALVSLPGAVELGRPLVIVRAGACGMHGAAPAPIGPDLSALRHAVEPVATRAAELGLTLAIDYPARLRAEAAVELIESLDAGPVGVCLSTGHAHLADGVPEAIEVAAGYLLVLHVHDNHGRDDQHRLPFSGSIDWPAVLMELEKTGFTGRAVFDVAADPDATTTMTRAVGVRTRLQAILDDLAQPMVFPE